MNISSVVQRLALYSSTASASSASQSAAQEANSNSNIGAAAILSLSSTSSSSASSSSSSVSCPQGKASCTNCGQCGKPVSHSLAQTGSAAALNYYTAAALSAYEKNNSYS